MAGAEPLDLDEIGQVAICVAERSWIGHCEVEDSPQVGDCYTDQPETEDTNGDFDDVAFGHAI